MVVAAAKVYGFKVAKFGNNAFLLHLTATK